MNSRLLFAGSALLLALAGSAAAEVKDLADLVPARTFAYLELHDPPRLARELHALVKGSYLQRPASFLAQHRQRKQNNREAFVLTWLGSPEFIDELGDWQGGCLALTGLTKNDDPEVAGVLRTGRSRMLPLTLRLLLLESGEVHCIGRVEGVPIFQVGDAQKGKPPQFSRRIQEPAIQLARLARRPRASLVYHVALLEDMPVEEPEEEPEFGCFLALMPDALAFGSTPEILGDTVRRLKGKSADPSLATQPAFRAAAEMRNRPGLFAWADPPRLTRLVNDALHRQLIRNQAEVRHRPLAEGEKRNAAKLRAELREVKEQHHRDTQAWTFFQKLVNPAGMHFASAGWSLREGEFSCKVEAHMKEKQTSPLLELLPHQKISPDLLRAMPRDAFGLFAVPLSDGSVALARLLKLADAFAAGEDGATPPSKLVREWEKKWQLSLGRDGLARMKSAGVAVHLVGRPEKEAGVYPLIVLEAVSEDAAMKLEAVLPRLHAATGASVESRRHTLDGQVVRSLSEKTADPDIEGLPTHYGRRGRIVVLGWHRGGVASTLRDSTRKKDLLNLPRGWTTVDAEGPVSAIGLFSCRQLLAQLTRIGSEAEDQEPGHLRYLRYLREMSAPMATMPPTLFVVKHLSDGLRIEFRQSELPVASATVVDMALTWLLDEEASGGGLFQRWQVAAPPPAVAMPAVAPPAVAPPAPAAPAPPCP